MRGFRVAGGWVGVAVGGKPEEEEEVGLGSWLGFFDFDFGRTMSALQYTYIVHRGFGFSRG